MGPKSWTIKDLLKVTTDYLNKNQIESPRLTAETLLAHQLNVDRVGLYLSFEKPLTDEEISGYRSLIRRRLKREPLHYMTGVREFWSLEFTVNPHTLIPRPETELLVEQALSLLKTIPRHENYSPKILDLGTGCGAIVTSLAKEVQKAQLWATDISPSALELARLNAEKHGVSDRIEFLQGDLWQPLMNRGITFDIILSNPPYIASEDYNGLPPEVRNYEPRLALDGKEGGMYYIENIICGGLDYLNIGGWIMLEMAPDQTARALGLIEKTTGYGQITRIKDYSNRYRVVRAQKIKGWDPANG
jgi:release factor glutamine methyltransferase